MTTYVDHTNAGSDVEIEDAAKAKFLLENGYISRKGKPSEKDAERGLYATSVPADSDPTLAENREKPVPVNKIPAHVANEGDEAQGETVHGKNMGLDAEPVAATGPKVKVDAKAKAAPKA